MRMSDWSSDVCSSDLLAFTTGGQPVRSFTSYVSAYDSHVGTLSVGDLPRDQQDDLIRRVFDADFQDYVMEHDIDHAYPNALWTLVVLAGMHLEQKGIIENFEHRTDDDRDQILNYLDRKSTRLNSSH